MKVNVTIPDRLMYSEFEVTALTADEVDLSLFGPDGDIIADFPAASWTTFTVTKED